MPEQKAGWPWNTQTDPAIFDREPHWPTITIVTPSLNQGEFLEETIRSVLLQNYPSIEYYVIDGGSTDNTPEIINKYKDHITWTISEPDQGQSEAINKGLRKANGLMFNWLNSDDILAPDALFHIASAFIKTDPLVICGQTILYDQETGKETVPFVMGVNKTPEETFAYPLINQPGTFFNVEVLQKIGGINESLHYIMDVEFWRRFLAFYGVGRIHRMKELVSYFRYHSASKSTTNLPNFSKELASLDLYLAQQLKYPEFYIDWIRSRTDQAVQYLPSAWDFPALDQKRLKSMQIRDYLIELYNQGKRQVCKAYLKKYPGYNIPLNDRRFLKLYLKVMILPEKLEIFLRKMFNLLIP
ncbi:MAG: glycosyltransferase family 2 protein [Bacteroidetes bacterium]|nr:glycosyltransferase family 2 protein [Bacteroidota bacterium]